MNCYWKDLKEAEAKLMSAQSDSWSEPVAEALASLQEAIAAMEDMDMTGNCEGCYGHHCLAPISDHWEAAAAAMQAHLDAKPTDEPSNG